MSRKISINPITRLEGHGKIDIYLDDAGEVARTFFQVPELRGFEKFVEGRPAEEMPQITSRICGICPTAHHMAATKALDALYQVAPPLAARIIRETFYHLFMYEDHLLHFFFLGGPDFIVGPDAPKASRNILGVIDKLGMDAAKAVIAIRSRCRGLMETIGGRAVHPVLGLPGGVAKPVSEDTRRTLQQFAKDALDLARFTLQAFHTIVLENPEYLELIRAEGFTLPTHSMGMVDTAKRLAFYDGQIRVVDHFGKELEMFKAEDYGKVIAEHVEPWSFMKTPYLRKLGWKGFVAGQESGVFRVSPIGRMNASERVSTPMAQEEREAYFHALGGRPVHHTLAIHWARLIETLHAAEKLRELAEIPEMTSPEIRNLALQTPQEGVGIVEAPRGTLIHHYHTDREGVILRANLIVASQNNAAAMNLSVEKAARGLIHKGEINEGLLNKVEMAFRAYDPCLSCATHSLPGQMPMQIYIRDLSGEHKRTILRQDDGSVKIVSVQQKI